MESVIPLQVEASEGLYSVTEAFLQLTLLLIQSGLHTATLQVLSACPANKMYACRCWKKERALLWASDVNAEHLSEQ